MVTLRLSLQEESNQVLFTGNSYVKEVILNRPMNLNVLTYEMVSLINGVVMGAGAGISIHGSFRVVTEKAVFAMPEVAIGLFPDVGASYFLSRLPGYFGEYLGLTGTRLDGAEMVVCGLATHFVPSMNLNSMENALKTVTSSDISAIATLIDQFTEIAHLKEHSPLRRLETINKCFSNGTVEEIILSLENEARNNATEKWITNALSSMRSASPTSLKLCLRLIREGRVQNIKQCLNREYNIAGHSIRRTVNSDFYEWEPSMVEQVSQEMIDQCFSDVDDDNWQSLVLPSRSNLRISKL
ncbi:putative 3-hydroxyisobutyryl-CoA hydrolase 3 [Senna tora]|uniref:3-hydroxyisobutyryl-CoA hydrolase n=1 Tax=Senna tora TaxID=362788 RepID=A0A834XJX3_9FABA|nr:putative 3-hydroxyisobutyryl-CoA hydrolase 3 [Senna tora]